MEIKNKIEEPLPYWGKTLTTEAWSAGIKSSIAGANVAYDQIKSKAAKSKLCFISDTHALHDHVRVEPCDILVHSGDFTNDLGRASLRNFLIWLERQPAKHKILVAGNHDGALELWPDLAHQMISEHAPSCTYLQDSGCEVNGIKFWGSPVTPEFFSWHFNRKRGEDIRRHWDMIPNDTDVLITHGPAYGILDNVHPSMLGPERDEHQGCKDLADALERVMPKVHCFGHIHNGYGTMGMWKGKPFAVSINASICGENYKPTNLPFIHYL